MPKIDYSELQTVSAEVKRLRRGVVTQFTAFTVANQTFQDSSGKLTGDSWDSARAYFSPYEEVASGIYNALYDVDDALSSYLNDFVGSVGAAKNRLDTDKLEELRNQLRQEQLKRNEINEALAAAFKDIPFIGNWFQENTMVETASEIAVLEKYQAFESAHAGDFSGLCTTLQAVKSGIDFLGSSGNFTGGKDGFKLVDYTSAAWYQTLKKRNDTAPKDRYEILEFADGVVVLKNGVQDPEKTAEYNWLITHKNWDMLKELGPEIIKIWLNLDDVEVLLDSESSTVQKSAASIFLLMSILPADEIEALIKTAKLLKNGDTTMDAIKLSSASWEALKEAHAAAKVVKKVEIADDVVDAGKVASGANNIVSYEKYKDILSTTEKANPLVDSLRQTGNLPSNYLDHNAARLAGWESGKALENYVHGGQIGGGIYKNKTKILPENPGRIWHEADVGLIGTMSRAKQPGTRLLYSNDGLLYITTDHYETVHFIGTYLP
ncbi:hypothetical protein I6N96_16530 [Enterococcus sp. BWM-S5]|uniref:LXG domain-containing protein n=1 Tax=Enterococcus larvae TaxID=2794352 RepID=A0ABS4CMY7_9ENTE|nr:ribonuclease domain-containing protein [Enterococcus larvae]MBP1047899.1 hypothetical protein [Enterococcus larvae]